MKTILIAGGTGFVGKYLAERFREDGKEVLIISRSAGDINWSDRKSICAALERSDLLINLAGKSVNCRYNEKNKKEILLSRTETTRVLGELITTVNNPPALWINSSTATIYRHAEDRPMTEESGEIGHGFSVDVAKSWEKTFFDFELPHTRQVALRIAIVLGKDGGVLTPLKNLVRAGLGGKQGKGTQKFSWIHIEDLYRIILFLSEHTHITGSVNCSSPEAVSNKELMHCLRKSMHFPFGIPSPEWLLETGAVIIKTETELLFKSRWVYHERLINEKYCFLYPDLTTALDNLLK